MRTGPLTSDAERIVARSVRAPATMRQLLGPCLHITAAPTGEVRRSARLCGGPQRMLASTGRLWVASTTDQTLVGVDPTTLGKRSRLALKGAPDSIAAGPHDEVLVALQDGPTLAVLDPNGPTVVRRERLGEVDQLHDRVNIGVVFAKDRAWVSSYLEGGVRPAIP